MMGDSLAKNLSERRVADKTSWKKKYSFLCTKPEERNDELRINTLNIWVGANRTMSADSEKRIVSIIDDQYTLTVVVSPCTYIEKISGQAVETNPAKAPA